MISMLSCQITIGTNHLHYVRGTRSGHAGQIKLHVFGHEELLKLHVGPCRHGVASLV